MYPSEIEGLLLKHPDIEEAAVVGEIDSEGAETVIACCVAKTGHPIPSAQDLETYCKTVLTGYKVPKKYIMIASLPKSPIGKILKREIKEMLKKMN